MSYEVTTDYVDGRIAGVECRVYDVAERMGDLAARIDATSDQLERYVHRCDYDTDLDILRNDIREFKQQLISELVTEIASAFKREFCIDYGPADEQEFLQNLQYLYT